MCRRGDIYLVDFGENIDTCKQKGVRPVIVVSNNRANAHSPVITVEPLTTKINKKRYLPTHVNIPLSAVRGLSSGSMALAEQVEAIDKNRLLGKKGFIINNGIMDKITRAIQIQIGAYAEYN
jgi:mRNA-degrading endonuclease toxin of MazEF toxin-antitoxin module